MADPALPPLQRPREKNAPKEIPQNQVDYRQAVQKQQQMVQQNIASAVRAVAPPEPDDDDSSQNTSLVTNRFLYWSGLLFLTVMNFLITLIFLPILMLMRGLAIYIVVIVIGLLFGMIFDFLIKDLEHLEKKHHLFAAIIIPLISIIDLFIIQIIAKNVSMILKVSIAHNPLIAGSLYLLGFLGPFTYSYLIKHEID